MAEQRKNYIRLIVKDDIAAGVTIQHVVAGSPDDQVVAIPAMNRIIAAVARIRTGCRDLNESPNAVANLPRQTSGITKDDVVAYAAIDTVIAETADQDVVSITGGDRVIAAKVWFDREQAQQSILAVEEGFAVVTHRDEL